MLKFQVNLQGNIFVPAERQNIIHKYARLFVERSIRFIGNQIRLLSPKVSKTYLNSFVQQIETFGEGTIGVIQNLSTYAESIEKGWNFNKFIPPGKLNPWIRAKNLHLTRQSKRKTESEEKSLARLEFLIARKIREQGIDPKYVMRRAFERSEKRMKELEILLRDEIIKEL